MFRLLGFLIGSALSIGTLFFFLGLPKVQDSIGIQEGVVTKTAEEAVETVTTELNELAAHVVEEIDRAIEEKVPAAISAVEETFIEAAEETSVPQPDFVEVIDSENDPPLDETGLDTEEIPEPQTIEPQWHAFWHPFRSQIAANGFVTQLERVTGLDYRVVKVKPGTYEVAFAYLDDSEKHVKLSQIESATGLDLPK